MVTQFEIDQEKTPLTVHQLNQAARSLLENSFQMVWVKGELSNVALPRSGHIYFTLKDEHAQVRCAMFKGNNRRLNFTPSDGMAVLLRASVSIYEERGDYQLIVSHLEKWGLGQLQQAFDALKMKLQAEGLFDQKGKKALPKFPQHIGIITSHTGAAIQDILSILKRRYPVAPIIIYHTPVQGKQSGADIVKAINYANKHNLADILILTRGGGSLEDLWGFNEESVARAIFNSQIPIITGIGHETDFTIADFVADLRAPTPSAAAETISPDSQDVIALFEQQCLYLQKAMNHKLHDLAQKIDLLEKQLIHPGEALKQASLRCQHLLQLCHLTMKQRLQDLAHQFANLTARLHTISPLATLSRGYAIATLTHTQEILRSTNQLRPGDQVSTQLADGAFVSVVAEAQD